MEKRQAQQIVDLRSELQIYDALMKEGYKIATTPQLEKRGITLIDILQKQETYCVDARQKDMIYEIYFIENVKNDNKIQFIWYERLAQSKQNNLQLSQNQKLFYKEIE